MYVTSLPLEFNAWQILQYYRERADTENIFDELKRMAGWSDSHGYCWRPVLMLK